jgi:uroporphyrinogen-III decarboxylase
LPGKWVLCRCGIGNPVSSTTIGQMKIMDSYFPEAHYQADKMYELARANYEILEYDIRIIYPGHGDPFLKKEL